MAWQTAQRVVEALPLELSMSLTGGELFEQQDCALFGQCRIGACNTLPDLMSSIHDVTGLNDRVPA